MNGIISSLQNYVAPVWKNPKGEFFKAKDAIKELVNQIALETIINTIVKCFILTGSVVYKLNICIYAFVGGFILADPVHNLAKRVNNVRDAQKGTLEKTILYGVGGFIALLGLPSSFVLVSLYYSANLGSEISRKYNPESQEQREKKLEEVRRDLERNLVV